MILIIKPRLEGFFFYPSPFIARHAGGVQRSDPVLDVRDLRGRTGRSTIISTSSKTNFISPLLFKVHLLWNHQTSLWAFWTSAAACAILSSSSNSRAVEPLKLCTFEPSSEGQRSASGSGCGGGRVNEVQDRP